MGYNLLLHFLFSFYSIYLKGCGSNLKKAPPATAREALSIVAIRNWRVPRNAEQSLYPHYRTAQNEQVVANWGGDTVPWKNERRNSGRKEEVHELVDQLPTSLAAFMDQFREGKAYLDLKLNI